MPHIQDPAAKNNQGDTAKDAKGENGMASSNTDKGADPLLALAATAREHAKSTKGNGESESKKRKHGDNAIETRERGYAPVTPSPFGRGLSFRVHPPHGLHQRGTMAYPQGPMNMGVPSPGERRLFPSPIRVAPQNGSKKADKENSNHVNKGETAPLSTPNGKWNQPYVDPAVERKSHQVAGQRPQDLSFPLGSPPYNGPYYMVHHGMPPYPGYPGNHPRPPYMEMYSQSAVYDGESPSRKRPTAEAEIHGFSPMKTQVQIDKGGDRRNDAPSGRTAPGSPDEEDNAKAAENEKELPSDSESKEQPKKQRVISPSSLEVTEASVEDDDDESVGGKPRDVTVSSNGDLSPKPPQPPHGGPPGITRALGGRFPPYYPPGPGYAHPPHHPEGHAMHGWHYPPHHPMYHMHHPGMMHGAAGHMYPPHPYPMGPPPNGHYPPHPKKQRLSAPPTPQKESAAEAVQSAEKQQRKGAESETAVPDERAKGSIKSVADWQRATIETGLAPSANRCVQLKGPIPSKYWGEDEETKDQFIPAFDHLVNYPDYMAKNASSPNAIGFTQDGKKHCVMCGKERVCSANALSRNRSSAKSRSTTDSDSDDGTMHIIPRQNKGLCTACDVRVWIIRDSGVEIKWCKGCKNFRPWAAFGDKGLATKCVRCRDRQREKYAMQKDELKQRRRGHKNGEKKNGDAGNHTEMAAARGLRNLIAATVEMDDKE